MCLYLLVTCAGAFDRKFVELYEDGNAGGTNPHSLYQKIKAGHNVIDDIDESVITDVQCNCCHLYKLWKKKHPSTAEKLVKLARRPLHYRVLPEKHVTVILNGKEQQYKGTIISTSCSGMALPFGRHPYQCTPCYALEHGKSSPLLRKYNRSKHLKYPRSDSNRAINVGVTHQFCSESHVKNAALIQRKKKAKLKAKNNSLTSKLEKELHSSWHNNLSTYPFLKDLHNIIESGKLSDFDLSFIHNWTDKKVHGRHCKADEQARAMAVLYSNRLGQKTYSELAPILGLPGMRQTQKLKSKLVSHEHYMPGINDWAIEKVSKRAKVPLQNGMDGTRVIRAIELYLDQYLVGEQFPPDVQNYPAEPPALQNSEQLEQYVSKVRQDKLYAAEAYSLNLSDTTGRLSDVIIGIIPEATKGVTGNHIFGLMMAVERKAFLLDLSLIGHSMDSASNSLRALIKNASPATFETLTSPVKHFGLLLDDFVYLAPVLRAGYPTISYPCWDHSGRTSVRNLMNQNIQIVAAVIPGVSDGLQQYKIASIHDLISLKHLNPNSKVRYADITPRVRQNCDATTRVITKDTIDDLNHYVPSAHGTILYLQASLWIHEPYRNQAFGPPTRIAQSLWAGITTWRRWRRYIEVTKGLSLADNFISRSHYLTLELMSHAGILHQLALFLCFPELDFDQYSLRNTGNRGIEAVHSILRGGCVNLPITSANLSFQEFLSRMNQAMQIKQSEHSLQKISGHSIRSTKKKILTYSATSNESAVYKETYTKPATYDQFMKDLREACIKGDRESKQLIEKHAPEMALTLQKIEEWDKPHICIPKRKNGVALVCNESDLKVAHSENVFDVLMEKVLDVASLESEESTSIEGNLSDDINEAFSVMLTDADSDGTCRFDSIPSDIDISTPLTVPKPGEARHMLKNLQPYREKPSKDRRKRFCAGKIYGDGGVPTGHDVSIYQFWTVHPQNAKIFKAKCFLVGQIVNMFHLGALSNSGNKCNKNLQVAMDLFTYIPKANKYTRNGRSGLLKASSLLLINITENVKVCEDDVFFNYADIPKLTEYLPYHDDVDVEGRLATISKEVDVSCASNDDENDDENDDPFIVETILDKRFHSLRNQYEYLVSWVGYTDQTWELPSNIPPRLLQAYENHESVSREPNSAQYSLRPVRKLTEKNDYIKTF